MSDVPRSDALSSVSSDLGSSGDFQTEALFRSLTRKGQSWRLILDTALDAVVVMNCAGDIADWNDKATEIFGFTRDEAIGRNMASLIIPPRYRDAHHLGVRRFLQTGEGSILGRRIEISSVRKSGEEFPVELSISPISDEGELVFIGFLRDISDRKRHEHQREQHTLKIEVLYRAVSFAAETTSFERALEVCLESAQRLTEWPLGHIYLPSETTPVRLMPSQIWCNAKPGRFKTFMAVTAETSFAPGEGLPGKIWTGGKPVWLANVEDKPQFPRGKKAGDVGVKSAFGFPIKAGADIIAIAEFFSEVETEVDPELMVTLQLIGEQVGRVFERRRAEKALREHAHALELEVAERKRAEEHQKFLLAELNHRVKNMLAVVSGIASQTARNSKSVAAFTDSFFARLQALGRAHSLLAEGSWRTTPLHKLIEEILLPYAAPGSTQLELGGPPIELKPKPALAVGMILHELVTNAAKYGALSVEGGKLSLHWDCDAGSAVHLCWQESGVGPLSRPKRRGFGSTMIEASAKHELGGQVKVAYGVDGIEYELWFPLSR